MPPNDYPHWIVHKDGGAGHSANVLWDSYLDPYCVSALGSKNSWHCQSAHNSFPFIKTPIFIMENKFDSSQIVSSFLLPQNTVNNETIGFVEYFGIDMDRSIITQLIDEKNETNGLLYASCFQHSGFGIGGKINASTIVNGFNSTELVGDWFWERNKLPHFVMDTCNDEQNQLPCNPTCGSYPPNNY
eukprot:120741_1